MAQFFETVMGRQFYQGTMPSIARSLKTIADAMEKAQAAQEPENPAGQRIEIPIVSGSLLVAVPGDGTNEIIVGLEKDGVWFQDLAVITEDPNREFSVKVYADRESDDYTCAHHVKEREEDN